jgi:benzaldehyde dehydrogenase (NAD)
MSTTVQAGLFDVEQAHGSVWNGGWIAASESLAITQPATGETIAEIGAASADDVHRAAAEALQAQAAWAAMPAEERAAVMTRGAELLERHAEEVAAWLTSEGGASKAKAMGEATQFSPGEFHEAARIAVLPTEETLDDPLGRRSLRRRVPIGVVGVITPWNFPLVLALRSIVPALALGNAVVLKPDPNTPVSGGLFLARLFEEAGLPAGVLHVLPGGAEAGAAVCEAREIGMVSFTGSTAAGRKVGALAGGNLKRVALELGGNSAFIVLDDADIESAVSAGAFGSFFHQGQICMASSRHLVHESIFDRYVEALAAHASALAVGDPTVEDVALGPIINERQFERLTGIVGDSLAAGARAVAGGEPDAPFFPATVITDVKPEMRIWREEIFGPVAPVLPFSTDDEAIAMANDTEYGLSSGVYTPSSERGRAIAQRLRTGLVHIGDQTVNDMPGAPFGGMGVSGNGGRFGGTANLEEFTQWQWVTERPEPATYPF